MLLFSSPCISAIEFPNKVIPNDVIVTGNIDAAAEFRHGAPQSIAEVTKDVLSKCSKHPNFVLSPGCDIPFQTSISTLSLRRHRLIVHRHNN